MRPPAGAGNGGVTTIERDDLEAALELLTGEERSRAVQRRDFWATLVSYLAVGVFFYALPLGLVVVWFDRQLGLAFLAVAAGAFVTICVTTVIGASSKSAYTLRQTIGTDLGSAADELWNRRARYGWVAIAFFAGFVAASVGLVLLVLELVRDGEVSVVALVLLAVPIVTMWLPTGVQQYRELAYFSQVASVRDRLEGISEATDDHAGASVRVSSTDYDVISTAERQRIGRHTARIATEASDEAGPPYAVAKVPAVVEELTRLGTRAPDVWQDVVIGIDSLQADPLPSESHPLGSEGIYELERGGHRLVYALDEDAHRVVVLSAEPTVTVPDG